MFSLSSDSKTTRPLLVQTSEIALREVSRLSSCCAPWSERVGCTRGVKNFSVTSTGGGGAETSWIGFSIVGQGGPICPGLNLQDDKKIGANVASTILGALGFVFWTSKRSRMIYGHQQSLPSGNE